MSRIGSILGSKTSICTRIITKLSADSIAAGSVDVAAISDFQSCTPNVSITHLPRLHAKVYIADSMRALVTSANLTKGGLELNYEYGVLLHERSVVRRVRQELLSLQKLGTVFSPSSIERLAGVASELRDIRQQADRSLRARLRKALQEKTDQARHELFEATAKGKTPNRIFTDAILYILKTRGPLATRELHPLIQEMYPELCNDRIDRVIGGFHFGKRWKHQVRSAQAHLQGDAQIVLEHGRWRLAERGER